MAPPRLPLGLLASFAVLASALRDVNVDLPVSPEERDVDQSALVHDVPKATEHDVAGPRSLLQSSSNASAASADASAAASAASAGVSAAADASVAGQLVAVRGNEVEAKYNYLSRNFALAAFRHKVRGRFGLRAILESTVVKITDIVAGFTGMIGSKVSIANGVVLATTGDYGRLASGTFIDAISYAGLAAAGWDASMAVAEMKTAENGCLMAVSGAKFLVATGSLALSVLTMMCTIGSTCGVMEGAVSSGVSTAWGVVEKALQSYCERKNSQGEVSLDSDVDLDDFARSIGKTIPVDVTTTKLTQSIYKSTVVESPVKEKVNYFSGSWTASAANTAFADRIGKNEFKNPSLYEVVRLKEEKKSCPLWRKKDQLAESTFYGDVPMSVWGMCGSSWSL